MTASAPTPARKTRIPIYITVVVIIALLAVGIIPRIAQRRALAADTQLVTDTIVPVSVATTTRGVAGPLVLPGTMQALHETIVYARSAGYIKHWLVDIGQHVTSGQTLAEIETPELDQEVQQARATLKQAAAALALSKSDLDRWRSLERDSAVSQEELDQKVAAYEANAAAVTAQQANLERLNSLQGFEHITAPFSGTITARNVDVGTLVAAGAGGGTNGSAPANTTAQGLFRIAEMDTMRVYVDVPQSLAPIIHIGQPAQVTVQEIRGRSFAGRVVRTSDALDPATRTLLVEVDVPNTNHVLLSGSFAQVQLTPAATTLPMTVPANALLFNAGGTQVATLDQNNVVHYHKVDVGRDYGATVEILSGIEDGATVVLNPSADIPDGRTVKPVRSDKGKGT